MTFKIPLCFLLSLFFAIASAGCENAKGVVDFSKPNINFKDVTITDGVCARLYVPKSVKPNQKLPLVVYFHGGRFTFLGAFWPEIDYYVSSVVEKANVVALSIEYRLVTNTVPITTTFDDSWAALKWVASHSDLRGPEEWVNSYVDFNRIYLSGDSAGATISHNMAMRMISEKLDGLSIRGMALLHPYFWGSKPIGNEPLDAEERKTGSSVWTEAVKGAAGLDDPRVNPLVDPKFPSLACDKVLVLIAKNDLFRDRGFYYCDALRTNGWKGKAGYMETPGSHTFFYSQPSSQDAQAMLERVSSFYNSS